MKLLKHHGFIRVRLHYYRVAMAGLIGGVGFRKKNLYSCLSFTVTLQKPVNITLCKLPLVSLWQSGIALSWHYTAIMDLPVCFPGTWNLVSNQ